MHVAIVKVKSGTIDLYTRCSHSATPQPPIALASGFEFLRFRCSVVTHVSPYPSSICVPDSSCEIVCYLFYQLDREAREEDSMGYGDGVLAGSFAADGEEVGLFRDEDPVEGC